MSFLSRLFGKRDDQADVRPLWHRTVEIAREKPWYAECGVADTVDGRFGMITMVLALVLLRMEKEPALAEKSARLTELFISDMDGQMRNAGVGDLVVGKRMGKLMGALGGRLGVLRDWQAGSGDLPALIARNLTLREGAHPAAAAARLEDLSRQIMHSDSADLLRGEFAR